MANFSRSRVIMARPQAVWDVLVDFGALSAWAEGVDHSCLMTDGPTSVGTTRRVQVGRNALVERITEFDPLLVLAYGIDGLPPRLGRVANRWALLPTDTGTAVTVTSEVDAGSGVVAAMTERIVGRVMVKQSDSMLTGLARRVEN